MSPVTEQITTVSGRGIPLRGNDIDTDRIMPARFLRVVSFEGLEQHLFEDDRAANPQHPFNDPRYAGATVLVVNGNFGCGSSREHAPQGLARAGIRAIVGESFSEIFQGNSVDARPAVLRRRPRHRSSAAVADRARRPDVVVEADVETGVGHRRIAAHARRSLPPALRDAFVSGQWNPTAMLLDKFDEVRAVADSLPYVTGF